VTGGGIVRTLVACACVACVALLGACGSNDHGDPSATAAPAPLEHAHRGTANVLLVVDTSKDMDGDRLSKARLGLDSLVRAVPAGDRVGLARFSAQLEPLVPVSEAKQNRAPLRRAIASLEAGGDSAAYDATLQSYGIQRELAGGRRLNTVIVLAAADDSASKSSYARVRRLLGAQRDGPRVRVFTIAYDTTPSSGLPEALAGFATASHGRSFSATPASVGQVLRRAWEAL
jgi:Ca-activated chloride channel family protein